MSKLVTTIYSLVLADASSESIVDKLPSPPIPPFLQEFFSSNPIFAWVFWLFCAFSIGVTAVAAFTGNLQKIIDNLQKILDFFKNNFTRKTVEVNDTELLKYRNQLLLGLKSEILIRQKNSLHELIQIDIKKEEQRNQVGGSTFNLAPQDEPKENNSILNRFSKIFKVGGNNKTELKPEQKIIDFYDRDDINGKLLILGDPGAGKTTELTYLAKDLIERATNDETGSIPIIFELSSWSNNLSIEDWLVEQLAKNYRALPKAVSKKWLDNSQLIPLLDGLDELGLKLQEECIKAINEFMDSHFQPTLVRCSRVRRSSNTIKLFEWCDLSASFI